MPTATRQAGRLIAYFATILIGAQTSFWISAWAQDAPIKSAPDAAREPAKAAPSNRLAEPSGRVTAQPIASTMARQLPPDVTTSHAVQLPTGELRFNATAGSITLNGDDGHPTAELGYVSYQLDGADALARPVTFLFNGGPGSASAWVHIIGFGPWRLPLDSAKFSPSTPPVLVANAETWLDFTDLVFIDPAGTGFSRITRAESGTSPAAPSGGGSGEANRNQGGSRYFYSVNGDVESIADMIEKWLRKNGRLESPKMLVGESYGGIRAPKVVHRLQTQNGVSMNALVLVSPVMDFGLFRGPRHHLDTYINSLPTIAAAAREAKGQPFKSRDELAEVEAYARGDYLLDLMRGPRDRAAVDRIVVKVASLANLSPSIVRQYGGRLDEFIYIREANRALEQQASGYDTTMTADDPDSTAYFPRWDDPIAAGLNAPVTAAMLGLYSKLGWKTDLSYNLAAGDAIRSWQWGNSTNGVESFSQLRSALALDPHLHVLISHGATDLRTPYMGSVLLLEQLPAYTDRPPGRVSIKLFPGGHMHYTRTSTRRRLHDEAKHVMDVALAGRTPRD